MTSIYRKYKRDLEAALSKLGVHGSRIVMLLCCERMVGLYPSVWSISLTDPERMRQSLEDLWSNATSDDVLESVPDEFELDSVSDELALTIHDALQMARETVISSARREKDVLLLALDVADAIDNAQEEGLVLGIDAVDDFLQREGSCSNTEMNRQFLDIGVVGATDINLLDVGALKAQAAAQEIALGLRVD
ncbi:hypothetical protein [Stenotrophomonas sp. PS02289]|uniref:hypothetical protein n=1 Tax=Stenotrophomonas sp. PS02289 TaxID=2991422 RepID=UPI00249CAF73|nr:hypothetical protein [Stenotrophomonas sp. PS02289]